MKLVVILNTNSERLNQANAPFHLQVPSDAALLMRVQFLPLRAFWHQDRVVNNVAESLLVPLAASYAPDGQHLLLYWQVSSAGCW